MGKPFIISINFSKILKNEEETLYTMLIDDTEMTIVYELTEWIRWIFSFEGCCYLTHENSVIHELEDIRILSLLTTFEINMCNSFHCVHKKIYKNSLDKLNLFTYWDQVQVPKIFYEKMIKIHLKFNQKNVLNSSDEVVNSNVNLFSSGKQKMESKCASIKETSDAQLTCLTLPKSFENCTNMKLDNSEMLHIDKSSKSENQFPRFEVDNNPDNNLSENNYTNLKSNDKVHVLESNIKEKKIQQADKFTMGINPINRTVTTYSTNTLLKAPVPTKNKNLNAPNATNVNFSQKEFTLKSGSRTNFSDIKKVKTYSKPFSVGEVLKNLRDKLSNNNKAVEQTPKENHESLLHETGFMERQLGNHNLSGTDDFTSSRGKKRKRVRKHKSKKQKSVISELIDMSCPVSHEAAPISNYYLSCEKKPNHVRFNSDEENDALVTENNEGESHTVSELVINNKFKEFGSLNFLKHNEEGSMSVINNKKQLPPDPVLCALPRDASNKMECESNNPVNGKEDLNILEYENFNDAAQSNIIMQLPESYSISHNLSVLMSLKEKFPIPVIIERFN